MKVYIITSGSYSDYHICAVTLDPDRAELLEKYFSSAFDPARIEEYDTDEPVPNIQNTPQHVWHFYIKENGKVEINGDEWYFGEKPYENRFGFRRGYDFWAFVCHEDRDIAMKIALDERARMAAQKLGL